MVSPVALLACVSVCAVIASFPPCFAAADCSTDIIIYLHHSLSLCILHRCAPLNMVCIQSSLIAYLFYFILLDCRMSAVPRIFALALLSLGMPLVCGRQSYNSRVLARRVVCVDDMYALVSFSEFCCLVGNYACPIACIPPRIANF